MIHPSTNNYWIAPNAISITLNALDNTEYAEVICVSGAVIMCFMNGIEGLGYDAAHNYQSWTLVASPTCFGTTEQKYLYVKIPRSATAIANDPIAVEQGISAPKDQIHAYICFPSEEIDMYGCSHSHDGFDDDETTQVGSRDYFYVFLGGVISASVKSDGTSQQRRWLANPSTGTFNTDEGKDLGTSSWWEYSSMTDTVTFLKKLTMAAGTFFKKLYAEKLTFRNATQADLGTLESVATFSSLDQETTNASPTAAITEKYLADRQEETDSRYIRKDKDDDNGTHKLTLGSLKVNGNFDAFGNATFKDKADFGQYEKGLSGGRITKEGDAELKSLVLRESLTVPKLTYNCEEWIGGNTWRSQGGGIIKAVADITTTASSQVSTGASAGVKHIALLDILANEGGKIAANDKCQGIFHITSPSLSSNALLEDRDYHNGHFTFRGFTTIYFLVKEVMSDQWIEDNAQALKTAFNLTTEELNALKGMNAFFEYNLRSEVDTTWTDSTHPQPQLNFAAYANETTASRQQVHLSTPQYDIYLVGMTQWTYAEENIQMILGLLDGFTINRTKWDVAQGKFVDADPVSLTGYGIAFGKAYMWGNIEQFDRAPSLVSQQLYCKASASTTALTVAQIGTATDSQATEDLRFLWGYWHYIYSDGQTKDSNVFLAANYGKEGKDAVIYSLVPEQTGIKIAADGTYSEERLTVLVQKNEAGKVTPSINPADANLKIYLIVDFEYEGTDTDTLEGDDGEALDFGDDDNITYLNPIPFPEGGIILGGEGEGHISPQNNVKFILVDDSVTITDDYRGICIDTKTIPVSKDGIALTADLSNEMDSIALDVDGTCLKDQTVTTVFSMFLGTEKLTLTNLTAEPSDSNVTCSVDKTTGEVTCEFQKDDLYYDTRIAIKGTSAQGSLTKVLTINAITASAKGANAVLYRLVPSLNQVSINKAGAYTDTILSCSIDKVDGNTITNNVTFGTLTMKIDGGTEQPYSAITLANTKPTSKIEFILTQAGKIYDRETVPVLTDGQDGKDGKDGQDGKDGEDGEPGAPGQPGKDGISISTVTEQYGVSADASTEPSKWYDTLDDAQSLWNKTKKYLWNKETTSYNRDREADTKAHIIAVYAENGRGILSIKNYYKASQLAVGETKDNTSPTPWKEDYNEVPMSLERPFLWNYEEINYTDKTSTYTTPAVIGHYAEGTPGKRGTSWNIVNWDEAKYKMEKLTPQVYHFYSEKELTDEISIADIVIYNDVHYLCIKPYDLTPANKNTPPSNLGEYFKVFSEFSMVATGLLLADKALIHNLITENVRLTDSEGNIYGGMVPADDADNTYGDTRFWIGGSNPKTAPTRITKDGKGYFDGILRSRGVDMRLTEIQVDDRQTTTRYTDFTYDYSRNVNIHNVDIEGEPYISVCHVAGTTGMRHDTDVDNNIMMNVMSWIILPYACEQIEGRVIEIYTPNFITRQTNEEYFLPIGITSSDNTTDEYNNNNWIDRTDAEDRNAIQSSLCLQWGGLSYTAAVMCSRKYAMTDDPSSVSRLRIICTKFMNGQHAIYKWMILESTNVRLCEYNNPLNLDN